MRIPAWIFSRSATTRTLIALALAFIACPPVLSQETTAPVPASQYTRERPRDAQGFVTGPSRVNWWNDAVFYQVFVRSFQDSKPADHITHPNDTPALNTHGQPRANDGIGDLRGLISRLDYLNDGDPATSSDLGITGLWLMPIHPSPSYHGYDITDYTAVNPDYGSLDDLRDLLRECHARGIRVILDLVINHTSAKHPWFTASLDPASPTRDWYLWRDADPAYRGPWNQRVWHRMTPRRAESLLGTQPVTPAPASPRDAGFYYGLFGADMPDLNFQNPAVSDEILRVVRFWLDEANTPAPPAPPAPGVDGFRLDAIRHLIEHNQQQDNTLETHQWLERFFAAYKARNPSALAIGEVWASTDVAASYVGGQMDMTFDFDLAQAMIQSARTGLAAPVIKAHDTARRAFPPNQFGRFLSNHDQERIASTLAFDPGKLRAAAAMLLLGPGVPFIYYAEELGMTGKKPDPDLRTPMPWTADSNAFSAATPWRPTAASPGVAVDSQSADPDSLLSWYRSLIHLRAAHPALSHGGYFPIPSFHPSLFSFIRSRPSSADPSADLLVVINLSDAAIAKTSLSLDEHVLAALAPDASAPLTISGHPILGVAPGVQLTASATPDHPAALSLTDIPPHAVLVYQLRHTRP